MVMEKVVDKYKLDEQPSDFSFWKTRTISERLRALEQRRNKRATGRLQDLADLEKREG